MADVERITPGTQVWRRRPADERKRQDREREEPAKREAPEPSDPPDDSEDGEHIDVYV